jgi:DNA-directed RNA polymerase sigma subunit (sigma70/sigma32)
MKTRKIEKTQQIDIILDYYAVRDATLETVAEKYGVTSQRIRQIRNKQLRLIAWQIKTQTGTELNFP